MEEQRSWWQKIKKLLAAVGIIVACMLGITLIIGIIGGYLFNWAWTGIKTKTLWDWLNLLGVLAIPVVVGCSVFLNWQRPVNYIGLRLLFTTAPYETRKSPIMYCTKRIG